MSLRVHLRSSLAVGLLASFVFVGCKPPAQQVAQEKITGSTQVKFIKNQKNFASSSAYAFTAWLESVFAKHGKPINIGTEYFVTQLITQQLFDYIHGKPRSQLNSSLFSPSNLLEISNNNSRYFSYYFDMLKVSFSEYEEQHGPGSGLNWLKRSHTYSRDYFRDDNWRSQFFTRLSQKLNKKENFDSLVHKSPEELWAFLADAIVTSRDELVLPKDQEAIKRLYQQDKVSAKKFAPFAAEAKALNKGNIVLGGVNFSDYSYVVVDLEKLIHNDLILSIQKLFVTAIKKALADNEYVPVGIKLDEKTGHAVLVTDFVNKGQDPSKVASKSERNAAVNAPLEQFDYFVTQNSFGKEPAKYFVRLLVGIGFLTQGDPLLKKVTTMPFFVDQKTQTSRGFYPFKIGGIGGAADTRLPVITGAILPNALAQELKRQLGDSLYLQQVK